MPSRTERARSGSLDACRDRGDYSAIASSSIDHAFVSVVEHDLVGKSVSTFRIMLLTHDFQPVG
jgi:hypothetical protein